MLSSILEDIDSLSSELMLSSILEDIDSLSSELMLSRILEDLRAASIWAYNIELFDIIPGLNY